MPLTPEEQNKGYLSFRDEVVDPMANNGAGAVVRRYTAPTPPAPPLPTAYNGNPISDRPAGPAAVDENAIREETRKRMQSSIDAITANYANLISQEQVQGQDRAGQTRAINARSGSMGSDFGQAQQEKTTQFNQQQVKYLEDEKTAKVTSIMQNIEDRASAEIQNKKQEALGQYEQDMDAYQQAQEQARGDLKTLASNGFDLKQLEPAQRAALLKQAGYEDNDMTDLIYNAMKPKPQQIDFKFEKLADGKGMFYGVDPLTGELVTKNVEVDLPPDWQMQIAPDGTVIGYDKNTGEAKVLSDRGAFSNPLDDEYKLAQIDKIRNEITNGQGDEPLSPTDAKTLGVPYGTTKGEASKLGIIPSGPQSAEAKKLKANVTSGLNSLKIVKRELYGDENKDLSQPGDIRSNIIFRSGIGMAREYASATKELKDVLVRLRTGAAISEEESKYYQEQLPMLTDNEATVRSKLKRFEELFNDLGAQAESSSSSTDDLFNEFEGGGGQTTFKQGGSTPYLKTLGAITGIDGSKYWKWGLDVDVKKGDPVKAPASGTVVYADENGGFGKQVKIRTDDGKEIWLSHFDKLGVKKGQKIKAGQVIALGGNSGKTYSNGGDGSHVDITMPNGKGGYLTARQVKQFLDNQYV